MESCVNEPTGWNETFQGLPEALSSCLALLACASVQSITFLFILICLCSLPQLLMKFMHVVCFFPSKHLSKVIANSSYPVSPAEQK